MKESILIVSRNSFAAITRESKLIDTLLGYDLFCIYSPRANALPPKEVCKELHLVELRDSEEYIASLASVIDSRYPLARVVSVSEQDLLPAAAARDRLKLPGLSRADAEPFRDKVRMKERVRGIVKVPEELLELRPDVLAKFRQRHSKIIVKPRAGYGSQNCFVIDSDAELAMILQQLEGQLGNYFAEQFISLPVYHLDALVRNGQCLFACLGTYNHPPMDFESSQWLVSTISNEPTALYKKASTLLSQLVECFGVADGVFHLEFFASDDELYFGEIAIRPAGGGITDAISRAWGVHLYEEHVRLQLGLAPKASPGSYAVRHAANMLYYNDKAGELTRLDLSRVQADPLVRDVHVHAQTGRDIDAARYSGDALFTTAIVADFAVELDAAVRGVMRNAVVEVCR